MHLTHEQIYAFELHYQGYDWFYSLGTSSSAGVGIGVKHIANVMAVKNSESLGCLISVDIQMGTENL